MDESSLYEHILSIKAPWFVEHVELKKLENSVYVYVATDSQQAHNCPCCNQTAKVYDNRQRKWRHLDTCQLQTFVIADVPRVECRKCGVLTTKVPWAEKSSRFTLLFEIMVIRWLKEASVQSVSRQLSLSWNAVDRIMQKAVDRGLNRRQHKAIKHLCVDEISFKSGHDYVTIVSSQEGYVEGVYEGRSKRSLNLYYAQLSAEDKREIKSISMDMSPHYRAATKANIPQAERVMCFDRYHVAAYINDAVDRVRKEERITLKTELSGSRYVWLKSPKKLSQANQQWLMTLKSTAQKTGTAWTFKETARELWNYRCKAVVTQAWLMWCKRVFKSELKPLIRVARIIKSNLKGIVNAIVLNVTNAMAESINSKIKMIKYKCRGFRNRERFKRAILFYCGGLDLYPDLNCHQK